MRVAIVCSAHGYGHVTREVVIAEALGRRGVEVTLLSAAPRAILGKVRAEEWAVDVGIAQADGLTEDPGETLRRLEAVVTAAAIDRLAARLADFDGVLVDTAPPALEAARRAGVPAIAVGNFDWAWIYRSYSGLTEWAERFAAWQAPHPAIALTPGPGMTGFAEVTRFGVVARHAAAVRVAARGALVAFGGLGLAELDRRLPRIDGLTWILAPPLARLERPDVRWVDDVPFPALLAGADVVLTKPGYGVLAEAMLGGAPLVWLDRGAFPEAASLEAEMWARGDVKVDGDVEAAVRERLRRHRPVPVASDAPDRIAEHVTGVFGRG